MRARPTPQTLLLVAALAAIAPSCGEAPAAGASGASERGAAATDAAPDPAHLPGIPGASGGRGTPLAHPPVAGGVGLASVACEEPEIDYGTVWEGAIVSHAFRMHVGDGADLVLTRVRTSCSCTVGELAVLGPEGERATYEYGAPLPAGTELEVVVNFDTHGKRGQQVKPLYVLGNVPGGELVLQMHGLVQPWLEIKPMRWEAGRFATTERREGVQRVSGLAGEPFRLGFSRLGEGADDALTTALDGELRELLGLPRELGVELVPVDPLPDGRATEWDVRFAFAPGAPKGPYVRAVPLRTDVRHPEALAPGAPEGAVAWHSITAQVVAEVVGVVTASSSYVSFGALAAGQVTAQSLRITSSDTARELPEPKVRVVSADGTPHPYAERFRATARPVEGLSAWDLELALDGLPAEAGRTFKGRFLIETGHPAEPELSVGFSGFLRVPSPGPTGAAGDPPR